MKKHKKIPLWIQVVAILLVGVIASASVYFVIKDKKTERYTVTFAYQDGTVIGEKQVKAGKGCFPPTCETDDIFRGWTAKFNEVVSDTEAHPIFYNVTDDVNLFYFNSLYVKEGKAFTLDLNVTGAVNISKGTLTLQYDTEVLEFKKDKSIDCVTVEETESGTLTITLDSSAPLTEKQTLSQLKFSSKKVDAYSTELILKSKDMKLVIGGEEKNADNSTINNKIYFLQEVG